MPSYIYLYKIFVRSHTIGDAKAACRTRNHTTSKITVAREDYYRSFYPYREGRDYSYTHP